MIAPLAKLIDWSVLQMAYSVVGLKHAPRPKWKLEEALEFLNGPDFIPAASDPARVEFDGPREFKFSMPRPGKVEENSTKSAIWLIFRQAIVAQGRRMAGPPTRQVLHLPSNFPPLKPCRRELP